MAGLYIHIPFCRSKCAYCDFYSLPLDNASRKTPDIMERYCDAILREFDIRTDEVNEPFHTIYIGGGTPTAIPSGILFDFLSKIHDKAIKRNQSFADKEVTEFTVEANPEDVTLEMIDALRHTGVNRISVGIQSFDICQLKSISRNHDTSASLLALTALKESGINYSADLIYGLPGQSVDSWRRQLNRLLEFNPPHFSAYLLSYEPGTRLYIRKEQGIISETDEETAGLMYEQLTKTAAEHGYAHYEISNFALPGHEAIHNSSYWNLTPYIGLGCSAHSFDGNLRRINPSDIKKHIISLLQDGGVSPSEVEEENTINKMNDYIITSLRTSAGLSPLLITEKWGKEKCQTLNKNITIQMQRGKIINTTSGNYIIPEKYWLTSDAILREVILDPEEI